MMAKLSLLQFMLENAFLVSLKPAWNKRATKNFLLES